MQTSTGIEAAGDAASSDASSVQIIVGRDEPSGRASGARSFASCVQPRRRGTPALASFSGPQWTQGTMCVVGAPPEPQAISAFSLIGGNKRLAGSQTGGIAETQELLDHCAKHGIVSDVEVIPASKINEAYERVVESDVRYRFVIDIASMRI